MPGGVRQAIGRGAVASLGRPGLLFGARLDPPGRDAPSSSHGREPTSRAWTRRRARFLWKYPFLPTRMVINVPTPVIDGDRLFVCGFYDGALMLRLRQDRPQWKRSGGVSGKMSRIRTPCTR